MTKRFIELLACPCCGHDELHYAGDDELDSNEEVSLAEPAVVLCQKCDHWYPIAEGIIRMMPAHLRIRSDDRSFLEEHRSILGVRLTDRLTAMQDTWEYNDDAVRIMSYFDVPIGKAKNRTKTVNHKIKFEKLLAGLLLDKGATCLELACGNGTHASLLTAARPDVAYVGIDISPLRLRETRERLGRRDDILLIQATLEALPITADSVDSVFAASVLQYLDDPAVGMKEARRTLKPDGHFVSLDFNPRCYASTLGLLNDIQEHDTQFAADMYDRMHKQNLERWMLESGFEDIRVENFLFLPGNLPVPTSGYRVINGMLERIPYIKDHSIMLISHGRYHSSDGESDPMQATQ